MCEVVVVFKGRLVFLASDIPPLRRDLELRGVESSFRAPSNTIEIQSWRPEIFREIQLSGVLT
jgi:hypothetical protein